MKIIIKKVSAVILLLATTLSIMVDGTFIPNNVVQASETAQKELEDWIDSGKSKTYNIYDVTGDGKSDTLKIKVGKKSVAVIVNGKKLYTKKATVFESVKVCLYKIEGEKPMLALCTDWYSDLFSVLLQYDSGKLVKQINMYSKKGFSWANSLKITRDKITVYYMEQYCTGNTTFAYTYTKRNGKWYSSKYGTYVQEEYSKPSLPVIKGFTAYNNIDLKEKAFSVKKGMKVKVKRCRVYKDEFYIEISCKGKTGWIKDFGNQAGVFEANFAG